MEKSKKKINSREGGAALLLALLIVSLLSLASLAIGMTLVSEIKLTSAYRHKEEAFWAAEAGIEKGLLFYRLNRERPEFPAGAASENGKCQRTILADDGSDHSRIYGNCRGIATDPDQRIFDLRVYDRQIFNHQEFTLEKDEGLTFRVNNMPAKSLNIKWWLVDKDGSYVSALHDSRLYIRANCADGSFATKVYSNIPRTEHISLINFGGGSACPKPTTLQLKAFIHNEPKDRQMKVKIDSNNKLVGGPYIYIESVGYYRGVNKRLQVKIDREAASIYNILDYVIFSRENLPAD